jgi:hypothetical protein
MSQKGQTKEEVKDLKKAESLKVVENLKTATDEEKAPKTDAKTTIQETDIVNMLNPSSETRLKRLEQFQVLAEKFKALKGMEDNLTKFILSSDGTKEKIELSNNSGFRFVVSNTQTIEKVLFLIQTELDVFIKKADEEVKAFII